METNQTSKDICPVCLKINGNFMIECESCGQWIHAKCYNVAKKDYKSLQKGLCNFKCKICVQEFPSSPLSQFDPGNHTNSTSASNLSSLQTDLVDSVDSQHPIQPSCEHVNQLVSEDSNASQQFLDNIPPNNRMILQDSPNIQVNCASDKQSVEDESNDNDSQQILDNITPIPVDSDDSQHPISTVGDVQHLSCDNVHQLANDNSNDSQQFLENIPPTNRMILQDSSYIQVSCASDKQSVDEESDDNDSQQILDNIALNNRVRVILQNSSKVQIIQGSNINNNGTLHNNGLSKCDLCGKMFKNVNKHIVSGHPEAYRQRLLDKHVSGELSTVSKSSNNDAAQLDTIKKEITAFNQRNWSEMEIEELNTNTKEFQSFLKGLIHRLPGPKHPAVKYFELRKSSKGVSSQNSSFKKSSNPERKTKRERNKRKEAYMYQSIQFDFYNCRKKAVRKVLEDKSRPCPIPMSQFEDSYVNSFGVENSLTDSITDNYQINNQNIDISLDEIVEAINRMSMDTSAGVDGVLMRAVKYDGVAQILYKIYNRILILGLLPECWKMGRTILLDKGGQVDQLKNWRPITILPVLRRIFEKVVEKKFREFVIIDSNQRGFMPMPGCAINLTIVETALEVARKEKKDLVALFCDINQAYNNIGHSQIRKAILRTNAPELLKNIIMDCQLGNHTKLNVGINTSKKIELKRGLMQGAPLSPILYNLATNHIITELTEEGIVSSYGVNISDSFKVSAMAFADDICILVKSIESANILANILKQRLDELGMFINPAKTQSIHINKGQLDPNEFLLDGLAIKPVSNIKLVKYLGTNICEKIVLDKEATMSELSSKVEKVVKSAYLKADQKICVLNVYVWPILTFKLQNTPIDRWSVPFIEDVDKLVRSAAKQILEIPRDVPDAMLYSSKQLRGVQLFKFSWEIILQRINLFLSLKKQPDDVIRLLRDLDEEIKNCLNVLSVDNSNVDDIKPKEIREALREKEFSKWEGMKVKGAGVSLFKEGRKFNKWLSTKEGLTNNQMTDLYKLTTNTAAVRAIPGRSQDGVQCRRCHNGIETNQNVETLAHVLGACPFNHLLRVNRHNKIRSLIAKELKKDFEVYEEVNGLAEDGAVRRIDIIAIDRSKKKGIIVDPTIRFEIDRNQPEAVDKEKKSIYEPTIPYYKEKYGLQDIEVIGLLIGARGSITSRFIEFCQRFNIHQDSMKNIVHSIVRSSIEILRNHIYNP
ncbi:hypothetical protein M8J77_021497 [Diaphorina citri]|nr:hypothetical protein M8J77_021497 [Diaphorina citri]